MRRPNCLIWLPGGRVSVCPSRAGSFKGAFCWQGAQHSKGAESEMRKKWREGNKHSLSAVVHSGNETQSENITFSLKTFGAVFSGGFFFFTLSNQWAARMFVFLYQFTVLWSLLLHPLLSNVKTQFLWPTDVDELSDMLTCFLSVPLDVQWPRKLMWIPIVTPGGGRRVILSAPQSVPQDNKEPCKVWLAVSHKTVFSSLCVILMNGVTLIKK